MKTIGSDQPSAFLIVPGEQLNGAERVVFYTAQELLRRGFAVDILIWRINRNITGQWDELSSQATIVKISKSYYFFGLLSVVWTIYRRLGNRHYTLSFSSNIILNSLLGTLKKRGLLKTTRLIVREPSSPILRYSNISLKRLKYLFFYWLGYPFVDCIIFQTNLMSDTFKSNLKYLGHKQTKVLSNPFDLHGIMTKKNQCELKLGPFVIASGRLIKEKGFFNLIEAYSKLSKNYIKKYSLVILGEGPLEKELKKYAVDLGLENRVLFPGYVLNPYVYYCQASLCVVSSIREGFPNILLEMMSVNSNVVSTLCAGGIDEIPNIYKCDPDSAEKLNEAITNALDKPLMESHLNYLAKHTIEAFVNEIV